MKISNQIPAGNIREIAVRGNEIVVDVELRDTTKDWFYWCFKADFPAAGEYRFNFDTNCKVGTRGAAFSLDHGVNWAWTNPASYYADHRSFTYTATEPGEVWFCMGQQYLAPQFDAFLARHANSPHLSVREFCKSRKGRGVEMLEVTTGAKLPAILLTARHHAGEMMANHAIDGLLDSVLADDDFGRAFRSRFELYVVPFMDKDGVIDGDQGKLRAPHDHNRDYVKFIYPECAAVAEFIRCHNLWLTLDMHCPWIRNDRNEEIFMVHTHRDCDTGATPRFAAALAAASTPDAPYDPRNDIKFGESWNSNSGNDDLLSMKGFCASTPTIAYPLSIEIPFANFGAVTANQSNARSLGRNIARAIMSLA